MTFVTAFSVVVLILVLVRADYGCMDCHSVISQWFRLGEEGENEEGDMVSY